LLESGCFGFQGNTARSSAFDRHALAQIVEKVEQKRDVTLCIPTFRSFVGLHHSRDVPAIRREIEVPPEDCRKSLLGPQPRLLYQEWIAVHHSSLEIFDGYDAIQPRIAPFPHVAHPSGVDKFQDLVGTKASSSLEVHRFLRAILPQ
jgi:hypothetical protein